MQTNIAERLKHSPQGQEAESILRKCVHCGFCLATCPTYILSGNELDSPRGRIYLLKQLLEGNPVSRNTQQHLDSCLTCRACETTCPSNVQYHRLLEIGAPLVEREVPRNLKQRLLRTAILNVLPYRNRFTPLLRTAQAIRPLLPTALRNKVPARKLNTAAARPCPVIPQRTMLVLEGCVQPGIDPDINFAATRVLEQLGISLITTPKAGCCGALSYHLNQQQDGLNFMRRNIDAWWPLIEQGCEAIVMTASGCGTTVKEYGELLAEDPDYADKARQVSALTRDLVEVLSNEPLENLQLSPTDSLAFQCPCSLQHGQGLAGTVEALLTRMGFELKPVSDNHLCCGSAGTYSIFQPELAIQLRLKKQKALGNSGADQFVSANIGCISHLSEGTDNPVRHWIQIVDAALESSLNTN
ncbi:glycolate oxidase subunit GlcF [Amphritea sp.]|uniref:glycolate oxidase subunit GlcF n=1 Tax=Amphritea sp. TaxID=1872502 RepID=UPI00356786E9